VYTHGMACEGETGRSKTRLVKPNDALRRKETWVIVISDVRNERRAC
jgi:hypothetical protein